jgi:hypothetical protein
MNYDRIDCLCRCCWKKSAQSCTTVKYSAQNDEVKVEQSPPEELYANVISLKVNEEPVYLELAFQNGARNTVNEKVPMEDNRQVNQESDVIYASIEPHVSTKATEEPVYAQVNKSKKM